MTYLWVRVFLVVGIWWHLLTVISILRILIDYLKMSEVSITSSSSFFHPTHSYLIRFKLLDVLTDSALFFSLLKFTHNPLLASSLSQQFLFSTRFQHFPSIAQATQPSHIFEYLSFIVDLSYQQHHASSQYDIRVAFVQSTIFLDKNSYEHNRIRSFDARLHFQILWTLRLIPHTCPWRVTSTENRAASVARETCHPAHSAIWWQSCSTDRAKGTSAQEGSHPQQSRQETLSPTRASRAGHQEDSYRRRWTRKRYWRYEINRPTQNKNSSILLFQKVDCFSSPSNPKTIIELEEVECTNLTTHWAQSHWVKLKFWTIQCFNLPSSDMEVLPNALPRPLSKPVNVLMNKGLMRKTKPSPYKAAEPMPLKPKTKSFDNKEDAYLADKKAISEV